MEEVWSKRCNLAVVNGRQHFVELRLDEDGVALISTGFSTADDEGDVFDMYVHATTKNQLQDLAHEISQLADKL